MARDPYKYFRIEARELLDELNRAVLDLEKVTTAERVAQLLRLAHTLKGAARVVKRPDIGDLAHEIETLLEPLRGAEQQATPPVINAILAHLDDISSRVDSLAAQPEDPAPPPDPPAANAPAAAAASAAPAPATSAPATPVVTEEVLRTVRVDVDEMDRLLDGFAEIHAQIGRLREGLKQADDIRNQIDSLGVQIADRASARSARAADYVQAQALLEQLGVDFERLSRNLDSGIERFDRELSQVRDAAERMRLIRADNLFGFLERVARDAAQVQNKRVTFQGRGGGVRLDAQALGAVQDALSHVVRNAVTHGIELPAERQAAGKPAEGHVVVEVAQQGRWIVFTCSDDGRGINFEAIRRVAGQRLPGGAQGLDTDALLELLLQGGISTAKNVTEVSGRGVGLDVLRDAAQQLEGQVTLRTEAGKGTSVILTMPLLIASLDGLLVETGGVTATVPIEAVRGTLRIAAEDIARTAQGESIIFEDRTIPFMALSTALSLKAAPVQANRVWSAVVVEADGGAAAVGVDRLLGVGNMVLRPVPALAYARPVVSAVTLNAEGNPQLVLDPGNLVIEAQGADSAWVALEEPQHTILIVDDSLTTRMLERSILESAGYKVDFAISGEEGMEKALRNQYALFLVDVEMPGMDGFTFIERIQADPDLRHIPSILVTSRASPEDMQRGRDVGARGYVIKSEFDQGALLARIDELVR